MCHGAIQQLVADESTFGQSSPHTKPSSPLSLLLAGAPELNLAHHGLPLLEVRASGAGAAPHVVEAEGSWLAQDPAGPFGVLAVAFMAKSQGVSVRARRAIWHGLRRVSAERKKSFQQVF